MADQERNPTLLPDAKPGEQKRVCPKCGGCDFDGRIAYGAPVFICKVKGCGNVWHGGIIHEPDPSRRPYPAPSTQPSLSFDRALVKGSPQANPNYVSPDVVEIRRRVDPTPDFRKGAPLSDDEEI